MILGTPEFRMGTPEGQPAFLHGSAWDVFAACWKLFGLWSGDGRSHWWVSVVGGGWSGSRRWDNEASKSVPRISFAFLVEK